MVREARFSWDDLDPFDPALRHERRNDFDGPDEDWVGDIKPAARRRKRRARAARHDRETAPRRDTTKPRQEPHSAAAPPPADPPGRTRPHSAAPEPRRHLSGADWIEPRSGRSRTREADHPQPDQHTRFPGDPMETSDGAA
jgi:hypothetical protein